MRGENFTRPPLMRGIGVAVDEADRDGFIALGLQALRQPLQRGLVERFDFAPFGVDAPRHGKAILTRDQRRGQFDVEIILLEAALGPHFDDVAKTLGRDQRRARAAPLDQRIGGQRRAMNDKIDLVRAHPRLGADNRDAVENGLFRRGVVGQHFRRIKPAAHVQHDVGEGAADIRAEADFAGNVGHASPSSPPEFASASAEFSSAGTVAQIRGT